jgi:hypothetical protein
MFERAQAEAFHFISMSLGDDKKGTRGEYKLDVKGFWISLKVKYQKTCQSTTSMYLTKIQTLVFDEQKGIFVAWAKIKEYRCKATATDSNLKTTYLDVALFLIQSRCLPSLFKPLTREFIIQPILSIEEKIDILVEDEMVIPDKEIKAEKAHIARNSARALKHRHRRFKSDSNKDSLIKCHLCDGDHAFRFCGYVKLTGKLMKQYLCEHKDSHHSSKEISSWGGKEEPVTKTHRYMAAASSSDNDSETLPNNTTSGEDDETLEVCKRSHDDISKITPFS